MDLNPKTFALANCHYNTLDIGLKHLVLRHMAPFYFFVAYIKFKEHRPFCLIACFKCVLTTFAIWLADRDR